MAQEKSERNARIIAEYDPDNDVGYRTLADRYGITVTRVKQIIKRDREAKEKA